MKDLYKKTADSKNSKRKASFYFWLPIAVIVLINVFAVFNYAKADTFDFSELKPYLSVGIGYEFKTEYGTMGDGSEYTDPISANFELGVEKNKCFDIERLQCSSGIAHDSHYRTGYPFNGEPEPTVNRVFAKVKYYF